MFDKGCINHDAVGTSVEAASALVGEGKALATVQISTIGSQVDAAKPGVTLQQALLPAGDDPADARLMVGLGVG
jgi:hypothetical protein